MTLLLRRVSAGCEMIYFDINVDIAGLVVNYGISNTIVLDMP